MLTNEKKLLNSMIAKACFFSGWLCLSCFVKSNAQPTLGFHKIISGLTSPVDIKNAGDGSKRIFIVEQSGTIRIYKNGRLLTKPFLDITNLTTYRGTEKGLLSIAFHPKFSANRYFFVYYNNVNGDITLARYRASKKNPDLANPSSGVVLFSKPKPGGFGNHNGGTLQFGRDGYLYLSIGDGGSESDPFRNGQNGKTFYGKMLRLDVDVPDKPYYKIPPDNPFVNDADVLDEIYHLGLRNPWKWSFDRQTGDMWIGDVGQDSLEEVDFRKPRGAGANFGWSCYEGKRAFNSDSCGKRSAFVFPVFQYHHDVNTGGECVIGGYVYRGSAYPQLQGYYICADYVKTNAWKIKPGSSGGWNVYLQQGVPSNLISFGEDEAGEIYASTRTGNVYHVIATTNFVEAGRGVTNVNATSFVYPTLVDNNTITIMANNQYHFVRIIDMNGREVMKRDISNANEKIFLHLPTLAAGTYVVQLVGNTMLQQKIYIAK